VPFIIMSADPSDADGVPGIFGGTIRRKPILLDDLERKIRSLFIH